MLLGGENALPCFLPGHVDAVALERVVYNTQAWSPPLQVWFPVPHVGTVPCVEMSYPLCRLLLFQCDGCEC